MFPDHNLGDDDNEEHTSSGDRCEGDAGCDEENARPVEDDQNIEAENIEGKRSGCKQLLTPVNTDAYNTTKLPDSQNSGFVKAEGYKDNTLRTEWSKDQNSNSKGYNNTSSGGFFSN